MPDFDAMGRLYAQLDHEQQQHHRTLALLRQIKSGEMPLERVDVTDNGWQVLPEVIGPVDVADLMEAAANAGGEE